MGALFHYAPALSRYFRNVDRRWACPLPESVQPVGLPQRRADLRHVRAVIWDIYGTLCGMDTGALSQSLTEPERLSKSAEATAQEFNLEVSLQKLCPNLPPAQTLSQMYLREIEASHARSLQQDIQYPEVVIERIWQRILADCCRVGYEPPYAEPLLQTACRAAYFFDCSLQRTYFYAQAASCLARLQKADLVQGIISNAQFYTPWHLRRLLREATGGTMELEDIFTPSLILFSYQLGFSKPNPAAFRLALRHLKTLNISADQTVYVGNDMANDIAVAARQGMATVFFSGDAAMARLGETDGQQRPIEPDAVVTNLAAVADMILTEPHTGR